MDPVNGAEAPISRPGPRSSSNLEPQGGLLRRINSLPVARISRTATASLFTRTETWGDAGPSLNHSYGPAKGLLVFVPIGIAAGVCGLPDVAILILNYLALASLAPFITFTVLGLSNGVGVSSGLLRAIFGNATELIISITAMCYGQFQLAQGTLIGSTILYSLFVLGGSFLCASYGKDHQMFSKTRTGAMSALVMVVSICLTIPTIMSISNKESVPQEGRQRNMLILSHGTSVVLFFLSISYLAFRFQTHHELFNRDHGPTRSLTVLLMQPEHVTTSPLILASGFLSAVVCAGICTNYVIRNIDLTVKMLHITKSFAGLVLLPLAGNLAKSFNIIRNARQEGNISPKMANKLDCAIRLIMTNILDTLLFIMPLLVLLGWIIDKPMTMQFGLFETVVFLQSIVIMTYLVQHGKTTYFEGFMLIGTYVSIAAAFYVRPDVAEGGTNSWK
ncbi:hypothetical protein VE04_06747 [Pseudogymnoascus sp. 24MN13]|nr:hypothetical protein VE04_06747 [Pseudogymnoascus sp. 24MN13]